MTLNFCYEIHKLFFSMSVVDAEIELTFSSSYRIYLTNYSLLVFLRIMPTFGAFDVEEESSDSSSNEQFVNEIQSFWLADVLFQ